jgi:hypothetical protein
LRRLTIVTTRYPATLIELINNLCL